MYLNVDLGEEIKPNLEIEIAVMPFINACNIACGGHAGNEYTMRKSILLAKKNNVIIGAHPSYPDRNDFGRKTISITDKNLRTSIIEQINLLQKIADQEEIQIQHIKFHGALYNDAANNKNLAQLVVQAIKDYNYILFAPPRSYLSEIAQLHDLKVHHEVFGDRNYNDDFSLLNRSMEKALITDPSDLSVHIKSILQDRKIISINNQYLQVEMNTICMHSDHDRAIDNIKLVSKWIKEIQQ